MEHLRSTICIDEVEISGQKSSGKDVTSDVFVVKREGTPIYYIGVARIHPRILVERQRCKIDEQPLLDTSCRHEWDLTIFVRVN